MGRPRAAIGLGIVTALATAGALASCSGGGDSGGGGAGDAAGDDGGRGNTDGAGGDDGGSGGDAATDAPRPPRCDPSKPFGAPTMLLANSFIIDQAARLSADELTLYYAGYGHTGYNGTPHLWVATRSSTSVPFANPKRIDDLVVADGGEMFPAPTADGLTLFYEGSADGLGSGVVKATRTSTSAPWGALAYVGVGNWSQTYVAADGRMLYGMISDQIYEVGLPYDGGAPQEVMSGSPRVYWPVVSADGLTIFYARPNISPYQWDMEVATRTTPSGPFSNPKPVSELNTTADENPTWISLDGCTLYFQRVNGAIPGNDSGLLAASRPL
jgi:hypothetical protein